MSIPKRRAFQGGRIISSGHLASSNATRHCPPPPPPLFSFARSSCERKQPGTHAPARPPARPPAPTSPIQTHNCAPPAAAHRKGQEIEPERPLDAPNHWRPLSGHESHLDCASLAPRSRPSWALACSLGLTILGLVARGSLANLMGSQFCPLFCLLVACPLAKGGGHIVCSSA